MNPSFIAPDYLQNTLNMSREFLRWTNAPREDPKLPQWQEGFAIENGKFRILRFFISLF
jgi:hypothetical protein